MEGGKKVTCQVSMLKFHKDEKNIKEKGKEG